MKGTGRGKKNEPIDFSPHKNKTKLKKKEKKERKKQNKTKKRKTKQETRNTPTEDVGNSNQTDKEWHAEKFVHSPSMHQAQVTMATSAKNLATTLPTDAEQP